MNVYLTRSPFRLGRLTLFVVVAYAVATAMMAFFLVIGVTGAILTPTFGAIVWVLVWGSLYAPMVYITLSLANGIRPTLHIEWGDAQ